MKNLNNIFHKNNEVVVPLTVNWKGKKVKRQMGIKFLTDNIVVGYVTCNKTITGRYTWNATRYDLPVFRSTKLTYPNGQDVRIKKSPLNTAIKETILDWVDSQLVVADSGTDTVADTGASQIVAEA